MITRREVLDAIARCESQSGWGPLDHTPTSVSRGDLSLLLEAAKAAKYRNIAKPFDTPDFILDDGSPVIVQR
jgi:hypothetical protein